MNKEQIVSLISRKIDYRDMRKAVAVLSRDYEISVGKMDAGNLKAALKQGNPVVISGKLIKGFNDGPEFVAVDDDIVNIDTPTEAIIIKDELPDNRKDFAIINCVKWDGPIDTGILARLKIGEIWLPPHSAIFNFLEPSEEIKSKKIQSELSGVNINIYERENYIDNCLHEIGHLFWRTCLTYDEKALFKELHKYLKPSAIYEYEWERTDEQEVFATIYKWYLKSILINESYYNILKHEEARGLELLQQVFDRIAKTRLIDDIWAMAEDEITEYFNPKFDIGKGRFIRKSGLLDKIKDVEIPDTVIAQNIDSCIDGQTYITLGKAVVPVDGNKINFEYMAKARDMSRLNRKMITDKNGHQKAVWVRAIEGREEGRSHHGGTTGGGGGGDKDDPEPVGKNRFGNIYDCFKENPEDALDFLKKKKSGYCKDVFYRDDIGHIDLAWGNKDADEGLEHIEDKHVKKFNDFKDLHDAIEKISNIIKKEDSKERRGDRTVLKKDKYLVVISNDDTGKWIVTAYDFITGMRKKKKRKAAAAATHTPSQPAEAEEAGAVASNDLSNKNVTKNEDKSSKNQTDTPEFKKWFGRSKVVGKDGKAIVVYHGTNVKEAFTEFKSGWFTDIKNHASEYANKEGGRVYEVYLKIENPVPQSVLEDDTISPEELRKKYDGIIIRNKGGKKADRGDIFVPFFPHQIKSATGNNGKFDPDNSDMTKAK